MMARTDGVCVCVDEPLPSPRFEREEENARRHRFQERTGAQIF